MTEPKWILVFGADQMLLDTRSKILETAGFSVAKSMSVMETERELREKQITLLLLCHTLPPSDCEKAVDLALRLNPKICILLLSAVLGPSIQRAGVAVHYMTGPKSLMDTVRALIAKVPT